MAMQVGVSCFLIGTVLGSTSYSSAGIGTVLPMDTEPVKVVEVGVKQGEVVVCSAVHTSGE